MATIYAEAVLAQETRIVSPDGTVSGGPVYYIKRAFHNQFGAFLAAFFAIAITLALGFIGCMVQSNSIGQTCGNAFGIPPWVMGILVAAASAFVFLGACSGWPRLRKSWCPQWQPSISWADSSSWCCACPICPKPLA